MVSPTHPALRQMNDLDRSSPDFNKSLRNVLREQEYHRCVSTLEGDDTTWLINYLDKALDDLDSLVPTSRVCLHELRRVCGARAILPSSYTLSRGLLKIGVKISSGVFSDVHEGTLDGARICVKRMREYRDQSRRISEIFHYEAVVWKRMTHPRILPLRGVATAPAPTFISDFMPGGTLREYIRENPNADKLALLSDVAEGLHYLHSRNVVHGGIRGSNILVDEAGHALIADFGHAVVVDDEGFFKNDSEPEFTAQWAAPEILMEGKYTKKTDVFSFAMLIIEAFTDANPFGDHPTTVMLHIVQGERPPRPKYPTITGLVWKLIQRCWDKDPLLRPNAAEVLQLDRVLTRSNPPTWKQLIAHESLTNECIPLMKSIFSDRDEAVVFEYLSKCDAQAFVDVIDKSWGLLYRLPQRIWIRCLRMSYKVCGLHGLLPRSLQIPLCYKPSGTPYAHGGFADVWKGEHLGEKVAAKTLRVSEQTNFNQIRQRFCREVITWRSLNHPNVLRLIGATMAEKQFIMVSEWMNNGNIGQFLEQDPGVDRLQLLRDITMGLVYMHHRGIVHGDLKAANILINDKRRACLADFSLVGLAPNHSTFMSTCVDGGTYRWMSPELLNPEVFGLKVSYPTKNSDCYALGMVIYEVLSGKVPFEEYNRFQVPMKVVKGERPVRPEGEAGKSFEDRVWGIVERCWRQNPEERASARDVLVHLGGTPSPLRPSSPDLDENQVDVELVFDG